MCRCEGQLMAFLWRVFVVTFCGMIIILGRVLISQGSPMFVESDNPASFSDVFLTRTLTYLYLIPFNVWLLLCPSHLCFDWSMGSIPLVESLTDWRNVETILCFISLITLGIKCKYSSFICPVCPLTNHFTHSVIISSIHSSLYPFTDPSILSLITLFIY